MIDNVLKGYNSTILAYGVTGTGKTHTMLGNMHTINSIQDKTPEKGICMFSIDYLFELIENNANDTTTSVKVKFL
jgi:Cdc6-like AAA superfamily ATPase